MKTQSRNITPWMAALLCLTLVQGTKARDDADAPKASTTPETSSETMPTEGAPGKFNKASSILGMDVRNQNDEHLGHVKDLVIDWKTEGVSYAVIITAPKALLGINEKLLAVPLTALTISSDQKNLVLNADKSKVEAAMGFEKNNWPSVSNPSWGAEPFWQKGTSPPGVMDEPAKEPDATAKPDKMPETKPDMKSDQDPESAPDMGPESHSDMDSEAKPDMQPDSKSDEAPQSSQDTDGDGK
jgi:sporulation protein YlmC with PRC-barrel domain